MIDDLNLIEAAARAMCNAGWRPTDHADPFDQASPEARDYWRDRARFAVEAIAEWRTRRPAEPILPRLVFDDSPEPRPWDDLRSSGLLWLINRVVFHPRGWALALVRRDGQLVGWRLNGDGREVWSFNDPEDASFEAAQAILAPRAES